MSAERRDRLWDELGLGSAYASLPERLAPDDRLLLMHGLARAADKNAYLSESFGDEVDRMPPSRAALAAELGDPRLEAAPRLFHRFGTCAKVRLVIGDSPYTGALATGAEVHGICRASVTSNAVYAPGLGLKWLLGGRTVSFVAAHSFEGFPEREGFFAHPVRTVLDPPETDFFRTPIEDKALAHAAAGLFQGALAWWRRRAEPTPPDPLKLDLTPLCAVDPGGAPIAAVRAPDVLVFHGRPEMQRAYQEAEGDFRARLAALAPGPLYTVADGEGRHLGTMHLEAPFVASLGGEQIVFFQHPFGGAGFATPFAR